MKLKFDTLIIRDFKAFRGTHVFYLDRATGLYFVRGRNDLEPAISPNGAGKSTLWDAICWCLTGKTIEGLRNPDIMPWKRSVTPSVTVTFYADRAHHTVSRSHSPNQLRLDRKHVGQEAVTKLLRLDYDLLTNTLLMGQGRPLFFDLNAGKKLELCADVMRLSRWDERSGRAAKNVRKLEIDIATIEGETSGLESSRDQMQNQLKELDKQARAWRKEAEAIVAEDAAWLKKHEKRYTQAQKQADTADLKYDGYMTEVKALEKQVANLHGDVGRYSAELLRLISWRNTVKEQLVEYRKELKVVKFAKQCPMCGQDIAPPDLRKHRQEIRSKITQIIDVYNKKKTKPVRTMVETSKSNLAHAQKYLADFHAKADAAIREHTGLAAELAEYKVRQVAYQRALKELDQKANPYTKQLRTLRERADDILEQLDANEHDLRTYQRRLERTRFWVKGFRDIKLHVIEELLQELELTAAGILEEVGLVGWRIKYAIERTTKSGKLSRGLNVLIGSPASTKGALVRWESWSGGERQRLRLVGSLALAQVLLNHAGVEPNIEVLDEPTQHLGESGIHDLIATLAERAKLTGRTVYYADHNTVESTLFTGTVLVVRDKAGARIVKGAKR